MKSMIKAWCVMVLGATMITGCVGAVDVDDDLAEAAVDEVEQAAVAGEDEGEDQAGNTPDACYTNYCLCIQYCRNSCGGTGNACFNTCAANC